MGDDLEPCKKELRDILALSPGYGMAANQMGHDISMFLMILEGRDRIVINPRIVEKSKEISTMKEGCFSLPGYGTQVTRPDWIRVAFLNESMKEEEGIMEGMEARVFLHESDHLSGVTIYDHGDRMFGGSTIKKITRKYAKSHYWAYV